MARIRTVEHYGVGSRTTWDDSPVVVINLQDPWTECRICGEPCPSRWGVPVHGGFVVANDWPGEWAGSPACFSCWERHERGELVELPTSEYDAAIHGREGE